MTAAPEIPVPATGTELSSAALSAALGRAVAVGSVERIGEEFGFAGETFRVGFGGTTEPVVAKLWAIDGPDDAREILFYEHLAPATPAPLPVLLHGGIDESRGRAWMVLEELRNFRQGDDLVAEPRAVLLDLIATVARLQTAWWNGLDHHEWLPTAPRFRRDPQYLSTRRNEYVARFGPIPDPTAHALFEAIPRLVPIADDLLRSAPPTLLHLDLGLDNILFLQPGDVPAVIDWARCARGPGVHDVASVLFTAAPPDAMEAMVDHYIAELAFGGVDVRHQVVMTWLGGAMIHRFITHTLGVARWAADTSRGLRILEAWVARTPDVVAAWRRLDPRLFAHMLP